MLHDGGAYDAGRDRCWSSWIAAHSEMLAPIALVENGLCAVRASRRIIPTSINGTGRTAQPPWTAINAPLFRPPTQRDKARAWGSPTSQRRADAGRDVQARLAARDIYRRHHPQRRVAVHGAADVYQDGAAPFWRRAVGVVGGHRVLPDRAARGLRLRPLAHALRGPSRVGRDPSSSDARRCTRAATVDPHRLGPPAGSRGSAVADGIVHGLDRPAVFCPCCQ